MEINNYEKETYAYKKKPTFGFAPNGLGGISSHQPRMNWLGVLVPLSS
jgi:hypothetical protein